eukprot:GILI01013299.1.p1 GENE.GILI01013299.1~~GILI01013299.1.p1  ORF type:complete len:195 (-),score=9.90 GILI01013299.1:65-649(-)
MTIGNFQGRIQSWWGPYCPIILGSFQGTTDELVGESSHLDIFFGDDIYFNMLSRVVVRIDRSLVTTWPNPMHYRFTDDAQVELKLGPSLHSLDISSSEDPEGGSGGDYIVKWSGFSEDLVNLPRDPLADPLRCTVGEFKSRYGSGVMYGNNNSVFDFGLNTILIRPHVAGEESFTYPANDIFYVPMYSVNPSTS